MKVDVNERACRARKLFESGYNCAQSVFLAFCDVTGLDEQTAATFSAPFGGGMGRLREVCGTVSGMSMVAGFLYPNSRPNDRPSKMRTYAAVQDLAERFRAENGSIVCRELLGLAQRKDDPTPSERTPEYYKRRPCSEYVSVAARIVAERINAADGGE